MVASAFLIFGLPFVVALAVGIVVFSVYVLLAKKFRLNWFEKNLLENAVQVAEDQTEKTLLIEGADCEQGDCRFWVPDTIRTRRSNSATFTDAGELSVPGSLARAASDVIPGPDEEERGRTSFESRPRIPSMHSSLDIGMIDSALYVTHVSNPALYVTLESEARKDEAWLTVTVFYQRPTETLHVRVLRVHHASPSQDCFVKLRLLPDRTTRSTSVKKDDAEPLFDEEFVFPLTKEGSSLGQGHTLELSLWSLGPSHKTESVGSAQIPLDSMALDMGRAFTMKRFLTHSTKDSRGEIMLSLTYLPSAERLTVTLLKVCDLDLLNHHSSASGCYVKVVLIHENVKVKKKRTSTKKLCMNPVFNQAMIFKVSRDTVQQTKLEIHVMTEGKLGSSESIGKVVIGADVPEPERSHFVEMLSSSTGVVPRWHCLAPAE